MNSSKYSNDDEICHGSVKGKHIKWQHRKKKKSRIFNNWSVYANLTLQPKLWNKNDCNNNLAIIFFCAPRKNITIMVVRGWFWCEYILFFIFCLHTGSWACERGMPHSINFVCTLNEFLIYLLNTFFFYTDLLILKCKIHALHLFFFFFFSFTWKCQKRQEHFSAHVHSHS